MNKIITLLIAATLISSCTKEIKEYATVSGKIENTETKTLTISSKEFSKKITINDDGTFKDTLKVVKGFFSLTDGKNRTVLFLANNYDLKISVDANDFTNISFSGEGVESNNYIVNRIKTAKESELFNPKSYFSLEQKDFDTRVEEFKRATEAVSTKNVDSIIITQIESDGVRFIDYIKKNYKAKYASLIKFAKGKPSPKFTNFENYAGGTTSMDDLKGKYIYIDVWATWCGPCKREIPFLQKIEKEYEHKNIAFVSISTDKKNKHEAWKNMIKNKQMSGIQLYAGEDHSFSQAYQINSIPRFILIDPQGNIVDADAPRPSSAKLKSVLNELL